MNQEKKEKRKIYKRNWMREKRRILKENPEEKGKSEEYKKTLQEYQKKYHSTYKRPEKYFTCCGEIRHIKYKSQHKDSKQHLKNNNEIIPGIVDK